MRYSAVCFLQTSLYIVIHWKRYSLYRKVMVINYMNSSSGFQWGWVPAALLADVVADRWTVLHAKRATTNKTRQDSRRMGEMWLLSGGSAVCCAGKLRACLQQDCGFLYFPKRLNPGGFWKAENRTIWITATGTLLWPHFVLLLCWCWCREMSPQENIYLFLPFFFFPHPNLLMHKIPLAWRGNRQFPRAVALELSP